MSYFPPPRELLLSNQTQSLLEKHELTPQIYQNAKSIHVSGLDSHVDEILLKRIFSIIGEVVSVKIIQNLSVL